MDGRMEGWREGGKNYMIQEELFLLSFDFDFDFDFVFCRLDSL